MESRTDSPVPTRSVVSRLHINQRSLQVVLAVVWIFDGLLKFQPKVLKPDFVPTFIRQMAAGQPTLVASTMSHMANFLSHEAKMWVAVIGLIEIGIGVGLLFRRSLKPALVASFVWGIGIYLFGEGIGMVLTGQISPLQGAPGAVCFYVLLGLMLWPRSEKSTQGAVGPDSSAAARGLFGGMGSLLVWAVIWIFEAIIWMFPFNRTGDAISSQMADTAQGEPGWYAHLLNSFGHAFVGAGIWVAVILAVLSLVIAVGPLVSNRPEVFIGLGIALALLYWVTGEGLGALLTGSGTDPSNGPIVVLIGLSVLPLVAAQADERLPAARLVTARPQAAVLSVLALVLFPLAAAVVPTSSATVAATNPSSSNSSPVKVVSASASSSKTGSNGSMKGMAMAPKAGSAKDGASQSMNMAAMAGLNVTDSNWKYTGPALPAAEVNELTAFSDKEEDGHIMQTPDCTAQPTSQQILRATEYVQATSTAVSKYENLSTALAAGYVPITNTLWPRSNAVSQSYAGTTELSRQFTYPVVHYLNFRFMNRQDVLDPAAVPALVYATTPYGPVLVAAMHLMPGPGDGPMPYGCLVQWHAHTNLCSSDSTGEIDGIAPCGIGSHVNPKTPFMTHVWQVPVAGGPLATDPSDLQVVEAAIMAQQQGLAPTSTGTPPT